MKGVLRPSGGSAPRPLDRLRTTPSSVEGRRRGRRIIEYLLVFAGCVFLIDALVGNKGLLEMLKKREEYRTLEQTLGRARLENARLREQARRLREDPAAVEDLARRELGLIKPGEKLFIVKDVPSPGDRPKP